MSIGNFLNADDCDFMESCEDTGCAAGAAHEIREMNKGHESDSEEDEGFTLSSAHGQLDALHFVMKINEDQPVVSIHLSRALRSLKREVIQIKRGQQRQTLIAMFFVNE